MKVQCKKTKSVNNFILRKYNWYEVLSEEKNKEEPSLQKYKTVVEEKEQIEEQEPSLQELEEDY